MFRILNPFRKPAPAPIPPGYVAVRPHVRAKPVNKRQKELHERLEAEVFPNGRPA